MGKQITKEQFIRAYRSAGLWFVALYMEAFLLRIVELRDDTLKTKFIEEIYNNGQGFDKDESGTRTRVNSLIRIIESHNVVEALQVVVNSKRVRDDFPEAYNKAEDLLERIENGKFVIPEE